MNTIARNLFIDTTMERNAMSQENGWTITRETETFLTVERVARQKENGHLIGREIQQLTVFTNGDILFYIQEDHPACPWFRQWTRERDIERITAMVTAPAVTHSIDY